MVKTTCPGTQTDAMPHAHRHERAKADLAAF